MTDSLAPLLRIVDWILAERLKRKIDLMIGIERVIRSRRRNAMKSKTGVMAASISAGCKSSRMSGESGGRGESLWSCQVIRARLFMASRLHNALHRTMTTIGYPCYI